MIVRISVLFTKSIRETARAAHDPVDGGSLNSERRLVERLMSVPAFNLHPRMISTAPGAVFLAQSAGLHT